MPQAFLKNLIGKSSFKFHEITRVTYNPIKKGMVNPLAKYYGSQESDRSLKLLS